MIEWLKNQKYRSIYAIVYLDKTESKDTVDLTKEEKSKRKEKKLLLYYIIFALPLSFIVQEMVVLLTDIYIILFDVDVNKHYSWVVFLLFPLVLRPWWLLFITGSTFIWGKFLIRRLFFSQKVLEEAKRFSLVPNQETTNRDSSFFAKIFWYQISFVLARGFVMYLAGIGLYLSSLFLLLNYANPLT